MKSSASIRVVLCLVFLGASLGLLAQQSSTVEGKVRNSKGEGIAGATLHLLNTAITLAAGPGGSFRIPDLPAGTYTLSCTAVGYAEAIVEFSNQKAGQELNIILEEKSNQLEEVVVAAEKRETTLWKLPVAVTAYNENKVADFRIWNTRDLSALSPNLYSTHSGDERNVTGIRGITTTSYTPAVATYIDGVNQFSLDTYIANLLDVERIEVLRGPQGTLYGRNAMGGVINIITREPDNHFRGFAEINYGNHRLQRHSAGVRLPIVQDKLFAGFANQISRRDGYYKRSVDGKPFDNQQGIAGDYFLLWKPKADWKVRLNFKYQLNENDGAYPLSGDRQGAFDKPYTVSQNEFGTMKDRTGNTSLVISHYGKAVQFTSQTAYQVNYRYYSKAIDADFSEYDAIKIFNNYGKKWNRVNAWTQEFRFSNAAARSKMINWTAGAFFFFQHNPVKQATEFGTQATLLGMPEDNAAAINTSTEKVNGQALFGQLEAAISPRFFLTAGIRADRETRDLAVRGDYQSAQFGAFVTRPDTSARKSWFAVTPKLALRYQWKPGAQVYLSYSRGYRAGGLTPMNADPTQPPLFAYKPEFSSNWEAGVKQFLFDKRLSLQLAIFRTLVTDVQVPTLVLPDAVTVIRNTGKLKSSGFELETQAILSKGLSLDLSLGITHAKYQSLKISSNGNEVDLSGKKQLFTPDRTALIALQYSSPELDRYGGRIYLRGEYVLTGTTYFDLANANKQLAYALFNARAGYMAHKVELVFWGRNLSAEKYIAYAYDFGAVHLGDPLQWGISIKTILGN